MIGVSIMCLSRKTPSLWVYNKKLSPEASAMLIILPGKEKSTLPK